MYKQFFIIPFIAVFLFVNSAISADKVKVGFIATLSGPAASLGEDILNGFTLVSKIQMVNWEALMSILLQAMTS